MLAVGLTNGRTRLGAGQRAAYPMIEDMTLRSFSEKTRDDYVCDVRSFAAFIGRSPDPAQSVRARQHGLARRPRSRSAAGRLLPPGVHAGGRGPANRLRIPHRPHWLQDK